MIKEVVIDGTLVVPVAEVKSVKHWVLPGCILTRDFDRVHKYVKYVVSHGYHKVTAKEVMIW